MPKLGDLRSSPKHFSIEKRDLYLKFGLVVLTPLRLVVKVTDLLESEP